MHIDWSDLSFETSLFNQKQTTVYVDKFGDKRLVVQKLHLLQVQTYIRFFLILYFKQHKGWKELQLAPLCTNSAVQMYYFS